MSRRHILEVLSSTRVNKLPTGLRMLVTSRPLDDIYRTLGVMKNVKCKSLDDIPTAATIRDIRLYVSSELGQYRHIFAEPHFDEITQKSCGVFEWARLACEFIRPRPGIFPAKHFHQLVSQKSGGGGTLLDEMYTTILDDIMGTSTETLEVFRSMMRQIICTLEPLPATSQMAMRFKFPHEEDRYNIEEVMLCYMGSLLAGATDSLTPIRPLHASFYDFLTDEYRFHRFFIDISTDQADLAFACIQVMQEMLCFNICRLESSYLRNSEVVDLGEKVGRYILPHLSYSCRLWSMHLEKTKFCVSIAKSIQGVMSNMEIFFWVGVCSLLGCIRGASSSLAVAARWMQEDYEEIVAIMYDGIKFIQNFGSLMMESTPHLYLSAPPFCPEKSPLTSKISNSFPNIARLAAGNHQHWPSLQYVCRGHRRSVMSIAFSPD
ncbi:hypothetical protein ID866_12333, partial [Astraeus odoratus]